jgi:EmrB/QacA subfamily drug resistance transporter
VERVTGPRNPWVPLAVVVAGTIMVALDATIVNVALHDIAVDLGVESGVEWVATAYFLAVCAAQPVTGWLADRVGRKAVFLAGLVIFVSASAGCAGSPNLGAVVAWRLVQGLGGGAIAPIAATMVLEMFPKERHGRAMAAVTTALAMTPAIGPSLGGLILAEASWHWLFLVNVPLGVAVLIAGVALIPAFGHRETRPFDTVGLALGSGGLTVAVLGLSQGNAWGWDSPVTLGAITLGVALLGAFVGHALRTPHPLLDVRLFTDKSFRLAIGAILLVTMAQFGRLVYVALELESLRDYSALRVGLMLAPPALAGMVAAMIGGRLTDTYGPRRPIMMGCTIGCIALVGLGLMTLTTPDWLIIVLLGMQSVGMGWVLAPAMVAGLGNMPKGKIAQGNALRSLSGQTAGALAVALFGAVVSTRLGGSTSPEHAQRAYNSAFLVAAVGVAAAFLLASRLPAGRQHAGAEEALVVVD